MMYGHAVPLNNIGFYDLCHLVHNTLFNGDETFLTVDGQIQNISLTKQPSLRAIWQLCQIPESITYISTSGTEYIVGDHVRGDPTSVMTNIGQLLDLEKLKLYDDIIELRGGYIENVYAILPDNLKLCYCKQWRTCDFYLIDTNEPYRDMDISVLIYDSTVTQYIGRGYTRPMHYGTH